LNKILISIALLIFFATSMFNVQPAYAGGLNGNGCSSNTDCGIVDACTPEVCDLLTNTCVPGPQDPGCCLDDSQCVDFDVCTPGVCNQFNVCDQTPLPGCCASDSDCDDANQCTDDMCDLLTNICSNPNDPAGTPCDDGEICTEPDECDGAGTCSGLSVCVVGTVLPIDTTAVLVAGTHMTASWMIPVIVAGIGIGIVIARKFSKYQPI